MFFSGPHGDRALMVYDLKFSGIEWAEQSREEKAMIQAAWERLRVPVLVQAGVTFGG